MKQKRNITRGFTLIELLIVVAIIAILAAIAVPNFLEAQVRSKVSRAKADMRTIATALESYAVDNNRYPVAYNFELAIPTPKNPRILRLLPLTTPISYLTSLPQDVFNREEAETDSASAQSNDELRHFIYVDRWSYSGGPTPNPAMLNPASGFNGQNYYRTLLGRDYPASAWLMRSRGPLGTGRSAEGANLGSLIDERVAYDPTNGTVSRGTIMMLGGVGFLGGGGR